MKPERQRIVARKTKVSEERRLPVASLDSAEASFVAERELLGMRDKSIQSELDRKISGRVSSLVFRVVKRETNTASSCRGGVLLDCFFRTRLVLFFNF